MLVQVRATELGVGCVLVQVRATELGVSMEPHYTILNGFLIFLYLLHVYW